MVLSIQPPKQSAQLRGKGSVSPSLHTGSIRVLENIRLRRSLTRISSLYSYPQLPQRLLSCAGIFLQHISPAPNLLQQQRAWSRRRHYPSPPTTCPSTSSTCIFTVTKNRKILPHLPKFTVIIFLSAPNLIPLSQEQTEQI